MGKCNKNRRKRAWKCATNAWKCVILVLRKKNAKLSFGENKLVLTNLRLPFFLQSFVTCDAMSIRKHSELRKLIRPNLVIWPSFFSTIRRQNWRWVIVDFLKKLGIQRLKKHSGMQLWVLFDNVPCWSNCYVSVQTLETNQSIWTNV